MKIALVVPSDYNALRFRSHLMSELLDLGWEVVVIGPAGPSVPALERLGVRYVPVHLERYVGPIADLRFCYELYSVFRSEKPDLVHTMTTKPNTYGVFAARMARLPRIVSLVSGLGLAFGESRSWKRACMNRVVQAMYRMAGRRVERTWFQNPDDLATFVSRGLLRADQAVLIRGSGVDVSEFRPDAVGESELDRLRAELGLCPDTFVVLMVARMLWSKGIREFVEASRSADALGRPVKFVLVGPVDGSGALSNTGNPELVPREFLEKARSASFVWLGLRDDVRSLLGLADLAVLPSYYPEGVPRFLLEAAAMGKPIVTCDSAGCREAVANGENGILVPPRDVKALRAAIGRFVRDDDLREQSGQASRRLAVECYDAVTVARRVISEVYCQKSTAPSTEPVHCH